ncbi:Nif3-like dinuclear metal center hexameric protein [bacterium]|nr:Nif3-like dinuclear metal center hexameric protein [bacterium]
MKLKEIIDFLETKAPPCLQESYDNSGLLVGEPETEVEKALISLDCTEAVVDEAIAKGAQLIISHHPIVFRGIKTFTGKNYVERVVMKAIRHQIALYAIHTNLDNVPWGVNQKIADKIGLQNLKALLPMKEQLLKLVTFVPKDYLQSVSKALFDAGAGHIGNYDQCSFSAEGLGTFRANEQALPFVGTTGKQHHEPEYRLEVVLHTAKRRKVIEALLNAHPYEEVAYDEFQLQNEHPQYGAGLIGELPTALSYHDFVQHLKTNMELQVLKSTAFPPKKVKKVALCGGSGSFLLPTAIARKADVFVSADFKYHEFFDAENKLAIMDIGHYESERFTIDLIHDWLREKFATFALLKTEVNTNPVNYL